MKNVNVTSYKARRSADSYGSPAKQKAAKKPDYRSGGMFSTGRAITVAPGTKKNSRVTTPKPSKPASKGLKNSKARRSADSYGSPANMKKRGRYGS